MHTPDIENLEKYLSTPQDWNALTLEDKSNILVLSFIGYVARPKNIPLDILEQCLKAFNNNRGKIEKEIEAVYKVLEKIYTTETHTNERLR